MIYAKTSSPTARSRWASCVYKAACLPPSLSESSLKAAPQSEIPKATALSKEREHSPVIVFPQRTQNDIKTKKLKEYRKL